MSARLLTFDRFVFNLGNSVDLDPFARLKVQTKIVKTKLILSDLLVFSIGICLYRFL